MQEHIYISLGRNCNPRIYITRILGISKNKGYLTCPFDLCQTSFDSLYACLETDFKHFFDNLSLINGPNAKGDRSKCGMGNKNITNHYKIVFNHEGSTHSHMFKEGTNDDLYYIRNNFEQFRKRYEARINNFKYYMENSKKVTFVVHELNKNILFPKLKELINNKYKNIDINYLFI